MPGSTFVVPVARYFGHTRHGICGPVNSQLSMSNRIRLSKLRFTLPLPKHKGQPPLRRHLSPVHPVARWPLSVSIVA